jgi:purine-binding chemotaxis protein CheW
VSEAERLETPEEVVAVRVGETDFGISVERVREVLRVPPLTRLPFPPPAVLGVAGVRGGVLPVVDLAQRLLGHPADRDGRLVVVEDPAADDEVALLVDSVPGLVRASGAAQAPPPEVEASLPAGWIAGVIVTDAGRLITVLDLAPVLDLTESTDKERR